MPTRAERERQKKGIAARRDAVTTLIANHRDEFEKLVGDNRVALGLSRRPGPAPDKKKLQAQLERARERAERLERELELVS